MNVACHVKELAYRVTTQQLSVAEVRGCAALLQDHTAAIVETIAQGAVAARRTENEIQRSTVAIMDSLASISELGLAVTEQSQFIFSFAKPLERLGSFADSIQSIARRTHLLTLAAARKATCLGAVDCGFAAVAREIAALGTKTAEATTRIADTVTELDETAKRYRTRMSHSASGPPC